MAATHSPEQFEDPKIIFTIKLIEAQDNIYFLLCQLKPQEAARAMAYLLLRFNIPEDEKGMLKLYQRPLITIQSQNYLVTTLEDVKEAKKLFDKIAETTKTNTDQKILSFYENHIKTKVSGVTLDVLVESWNTANPGDTRSDDGLRWWLIRLNHLGWVQIKKGVQEDKRKDTFYPLKGKAHQEKLGESSLKTDIQPDLDLKLRISFKSWLETISEEGIVTQYAKLKFDDGALEQITPDELVKIISGVDIDTLLIVSKVESESKLEIKPESSGKDEIKPDSLISEKKRECGQCSKFRTGECSFPHGPGSPGVHCDYAAKCVDFSKLKGKRDQSEDYPEPGENC